MSSSQRSRTQLNKLSEVFVGGKDKDVLKSVYYSGPDGVVAAGSTGSKGLGASDGWLVRLSAEAKPLWDRSYGGSSTDEFCSVAVLPGGGLALFGSTASLGNGGFDYWLVRTDAWGNVAWQRTFGTDLSETGTAMAVAADGGFVLAGQFGVGKSPTGLVYRTDNWGNLTCKEAGVCAGVPDSACDDKDPCTADTCDGLTGCGHKAHPDGAQCGTGKACSSGKCLSL